MNELISIKNDRPVVDSRQVAKNFHKDHKHVLDAIRNLVAQNSATKKMFYETEFTYRGQKFPKYLIDRDGFTLLVMGFTGKKAIEWKLKYIAEFNKMEKQIMSVQAERQTEAWLNTRKVGILARKAETDVIKQLVEYAKSLGSTHSDMLYLTYTRLANSAAGVKKRDYANVMQLNLLNQIEGIILKVIRLGMNAGKHYKEIYKDCKTRLNAWLELGMIDVNLLQGGIV